MGGKTYVSWVKQFKTGICFSFRPSWPQRGQKWSITYFSSWDFNICFWKVLVSHIVHHNLPEVKKEYYYFILLHRSWNIYIYIHKACLYGISTYLFESIRSEVIDLWYDLWKIKIWLPMTSERPDVRSEAIFEFLDPENLYLDTHWANSGI